MSNSQLQQYFTPQQNLAQSPPQPQQQQQQPQEQHQQQQIQYDPNQQPLVQQSLSQPQPQSDPQQQITPPPQSPPQDQLDSSVSSAPTPTTPAPTTPLPPPQMTASGINPGLLRPKMVERVVTFLQSTFSNTNKSSANKNIDLVKILLFLEDKDCYSAEIAEGFARTIPEHFISPLLIRAAKKGFVLSQYCYCYLLLLTKRNPDIMDDDGNGSNKNTYAMNTIITQDELDQLEAELNNLHSRTDVVYISQQDRKTEHRNGIIRSAILTSFGLIALIATSRFFFGKNNTNNPSSNPPSHIDIQDNIANINNSANPIGTIPTVRQIDYTKQFTALGSNLGTQLNTIMTNIDILNAKFNEIKSNIDNISIGTNEALNSNQKQLKQELDSQSEFIKNENNRLEEVLTSALETKIGAKITDEATTTSQELGVISNNVTSLSEAINFLNSALSNGIGDLESAVYANFLKVHSSLQDVTKGLTTSSSSSLSNLHNTTDLKSTDAHQSSVLNSLLHQAQNDSNGGYEEENGENKGNDDVSPTKVHSFMTPFQQLSNSAPGLPTSLGNAFSLLEKVKSQNNGDKNNDVENDVVGVGKQDDTTTSQTEKELQDKIERDAQDAAERAAATINNIMGQVNLFGQVDNDKTDKTVTDENDNNNNKNNKSDIKIPNTFTPSPFGTPMDMNESDPSDKIQIPSVASILARANNQNLNQNNLNVTQDESTDIPTTTTTTTTTNNNTNLHANTATSLNTQPTLTQSQPTTTVSSPFNSTDTSNIINADIKQLPPAFCTKCISMSAFKSKLFTIIDDIYATLPLKKDDNGQQIPYLSHTLPKQPIVQDSTISEYYLTENIRALKSIRIYLNNIIKTPTNEQKRYISASNAIIRSISQIPLYTSFLTQIGFVLDWQRCAMDLTCMCCNNHNNSRKNTGQDDDHDDNDKNGNTNTCQCPCALKKVNSVELWVNTPQPLTEHQYHTECGDNEDNICICGTLFRVQFALEQLNVILKGL